MKMDVFQKELNLVRYRIRQIRSQLANLERCLDVLEWLHRKKVIQVWASQKKDSHDVVHDERLEVKVKDA